MYIYIYIPTRVYELRVGTYRYMAGLEMLPNVGGGGGRGREVKIKNCQGEASNGSAADISG